MKFSRPVGIIETHESPAHKRTSHRARTEHRQSPLEFVGIDGESSADHARRYVLLGCGKDTLENPDGLGFIAICEWLYSHFLHDTRRVYAGFHLGYDFTNWLKTLPEERARMLLTAEGRALRQPKLSKNPTPFPVRWQGWEFDILGVKRLRIRPEGATRWMYICDAGPFFQTSLMNAIDPENWSEPIVTPREWDILKEGKDGRDTASLGPDMRRYNNLENEVFSRLMDRLQSGFRDMGIRLKPSQWMGPGQAAQAWLDNNGEPRAILGSELRDTMDPYFLNAARMSYFGGWFEIMAHGLIPGPSWEYDINSAYPAIIAQLPCLLHGSASRGSGRPPRGHKDILCLVRARVWTRANWRSRKPQDRLGAALHRLPNGRILRPMVTEGWYWLDEIQQAVRAGAIRHIDYMEWTAYHPCDCLPPLREVRDLYTLRKQAGKKTPLGIAAKLVYNSMYGKFAQSIGNPKYGNSIYASRITSGCRKMILNAIATHPKGQEDVLMVATDGVYFRSPHPGLPISGKLGEWDMGRKDNLCLFKPGVYWDDAARGRIQSGENAIFKARGVNAKAFSGCLQEIDDAFMAMREKGKLPIVGNQWDWPQVWFPIDFSMTTAVQALHRNDWSLAGKVHTDQLVRQSSDPDDKRYVAYWDDDIMRTIPWIPEAFIGDDAIFDVRSTPYEKRFGIEDLTDPLNREMYGVTPDGTVPDLLANVLYDH